ncbi:MAG: hypothetical protein J6T88_04260 [Bacteroidales bacterium]|nr:hypothetical protein [Bacteroidales bacterium]
MATITLEYDGRNSDIKQLIRLLLTFNGEGGTANQYCLWQQERHSVGRLRQ